MSPKNSYLLELQIGPRESGEQLLQMPQCSYATAQPRFRFRGNRPEYILRPDYTPCLYTIWIRGLNWPELTIKGSFILEHPHVKAIFGRKKNYPVKIGP